MIRSNLHLVLAAAMLTGLLVYNIRERSAAQGAGEAPQAAAAARPDINSLTTYRASEWGVAAPEAVAAARPDINSLTTYRASEWGVAPEAVAAARPDINALTIYRASEWGLAPSRPAAFDAHHHLMLVK
jgi:hypothetical protein